MNQYHNFEFLNRLAFERVAGSAEELKAANMIITECHKYHVEAHLEDFEIDGYTITSAALETIDGSYPVTGVGMSGSTPSEGIVGEFMDISSDEQLKTIPSLEGKIVLIHTRVLYKTYQLLTEKRASGFICVSGSVYDDETTSDLEQMQLRNRHYSFGKIPGVCMRMKDAERLLLSNPKEVKLTLMQEEFKNTSHNVVATIPGNSKKNEIICFTAHYDSVRFSSGAYDNASGSATIMEILAYFSEHRPQRTLKFVWCGAEEVGLEGSKAYVKHHKEELSNYLFCINVDMTGVVIGKDIACCTTDPTCVSYLTCLSKELGFALEAKQGVYSSDSSSFADKGVPALSFARIAPKGGEEIHSRKDVLDYLNPKYFYDTVAFIIQFANHLVDSVYFPFTREVPEDMKKELDIYFGRKEKEASKDNAS